MSDAFSNYGQVIEGSFNEIYNALTLRISHYWPLTILLFPAKVIADKMSERSKGYGFVTYASQDEAENAITEMNGKVIIKFVTIPLFLGLLVIRTDKTLCRH